MVKRLCELGSVDYAVFLMGKVDEVDAFMCNLIVRGYVEMGDSGKGLGFYKGFVLGRCVRMNKYSFPVIVKACGAVRDVVEGEKVHCRSLKVGYGGAVYVRNALIQMYSVCGRMRDARGVFDGGRGSDLVTWNTMIGGYVKNREVSVARELFDEMDEKDEFTWNTMVAGYAAIGEMKKAWDLFERMPRRDVVSWNCMVDGYAGIGDVVSARAFFDRMPHRNVVTWNTMLALLARCKKYDECLELFDRMMDGKEAKPNEATLVSVLTACGYLGRLDKGKWVHTYVESNSTIDLDVLLLTALLTMYLKCGDMDMAKNVFDMMPEKSVVSWNSMIMGYGTHGFGEKALEMFLEMESSGLAPNDTTFVCLLAACGQSGLVLEGWWYFDMMHRVYKIEPKVEHYGCMVDLLSRAGLMKDTEELIKIMPMEGGSTLWGALLSSCRTHSSSQLAEVVGKRLVDLAPKEVGPYLLLSNSYAAEGRWDDVENVRKLMNDNDLQKTGGSSMVQNTEVVSESSFEGIPARKRSMIYSMLREMGAHLKLSWGTDSRLPES